jgi:rubrerythrin
MIRQQVYEVFTGFEERSADLYLEMSVRFMDNIELSWFWVEMAMQEKQHAGMLEYCRETGMFSDQLPGTEEIQRLGALFRRLGDKVASKDLNLDSAFEVAIELESSEINDIYNRLTAKVDGPLHVIRKKIELSMDNHFERLKEAAVRFGVSPWVRDKLSRLAETT